MGVKSRKRRVGLGGKASINSGHEILLQKWCYVNILEILLVDAWGETLEAAEKSVATSF
jgi:hypothetical protein